MKELLLGFLKVGCFSFGGAYGAIPLIRDVVLQYGWMTEEKLADMIAVSESTPGPIMVNLATYVGSLRAGAAGAAAATLAVVLPSFLVILLVAAVMKKALKNRYVQALLRGMKPSMAGIILAAAARLIWLAAFPQGGADLPAVCITAVLALLCFGLPKLTKRTFSPILLIAAGAAMGLVIYGI